MRAPRDLIRNRSRGCAALDVERDGERWRELLGRARDDRPPRRRNRDLPTRCQLAADTVQAPFKHRSSSIQAPFKLHSSTVQAPFKHRSSTVQLPFTHLRPRRPRRPGPPSVPRSLAARRWSQPIQVGTHHTWLPEPGPPGRESHPHDQ